MVTPLLFLAGCLAVLTVGALAAGHLLPGVGLGIGTLLIADFVRPTVTGSRRH